MNRKLTFFDSYVGLSRKNNPIYFFQLKNKKIRIKIINILLDIIINKKKK